MVYYHPQYNWVVKSPIHTNLPRFFSLLKCHKGSRHFSLWSGIENAGANFKKIWPTMPPFNGFGHANLHPSKVMIVIHSWELTYPCCQALLSRWFSFPQVGYVSVPWRVDIIYIWWVYYICLNSIKRSAGTWTCQWLFLVPLKGGRDFNWRYIPLIYHLYIAFWGGYMLPTTF